MKWFKSIVPGAVLPLIFQFSAFGGEISSGAAPNSLNYQGRLERDNAPITGVVHITFRIYDAPSGGTAVYTGAEQVVNAVQGIFSASITPPLSVFASARSLYLEIQVESDVLTPREPLNSVAFSLVAKKVEDGAYLTLSTLTTTGRVGIGTDPSIYSLTVDSSVWIRSGQLVFPDGSVMTTGGVGSAGTLANNGDGVVLVDQDQNGTGDVVFQKPLTEFARITNAGDMGIGSASPMGKLDVDGSVYVGSQGLYDRTGGSVTVSGLYVRGGGVTGANGEYMLLGSTDNVIALVSGGSERMRVHSNGNIGIGLSNPTDGLQAAGDMSSDAGVRGGRVFIGGYSPWGGLSNEVGAQSGYDLILQRTNNYSVGIGTNTPREKLHVNGSVRADKGLIASTAAVSGAVTIGGSLSVSSAGVNTATLPSTTINGTLHVTGALTSGPSEPALLNATQTFTAPNIFSHQVTVSTDILVSNRMGIGVLDFDFPESRYIQIGDDQPEFANDDASAYIVSGSNADSGISFYRGAVEAARLETQGPVNAPALALVAGSTKSYVDSTYYRIYNSVVMISTGNSPVGATTPAVYISSSLGNVGMGTAVMDPNHRLTVEGNLRISTASSPGQSYGIIFADGTSITSADAGLSVGGVSNNDDAVIQSDLDVNGTGSVILRASSLDALSVNPGGNVGIGTLSPIARLNVRGGDLVLGTPDLGSYASNGLNDAIISGNLVVDKGIIQRSDTPVEFRAMTISGDVALSTSAAARTGIGTSSPLQRLQVAGDINIESGYGLRINNTAAGAQYLRGDGTRFVSSAVQDADLPSTIVRTSRSIATTSPLSGGSDLSADRTLSVGGLSSLGTANYVVGVNSAAGAWEYKNIAGVANETNVSHAAGQITIGIADPLITGKGGTGADLSGAAQGGLVYSTAAGGPLGATGALTGMLKGNGTSAPSALTGTSNRVAKWTDANTIGNSNISDNGTTVSVTGALSVSGAGDFGGNVDMNNHRITNLSWPISWTDGASKYYVDRNTGGGSGAWGLGGNAVTGGELLGTTNYMDLVMVTDNVARLTIRDDGILTVATFTAAGIVKSDSSGNLYSNGAVSLSGSETSGTLPINKGGTNRTSWGTQYALIYAPTTASLGPIPDGIGTTQEVLHGNASGAPTWGKVALGSDVDGTLPLDFGGTGVAATSANQAFNALSPMTATGDIIYRNSSGNAARLAGSAGFLKSTGASAPSWSAVTLSGSDVSGILGSANGGTGNGFTKFSGPSGAEKTFTLPDASATILTTNTTVTVAQGGTGATTLSGVVHGNGAGAFTAGDVDLSSEVTGTLPIANGGTGNATGNAATATALASNGANCSAGSYPLGVDASGAAESCTSLGSASANHAVCWKTATTLGYCSDAPIADGTCTCN